MLIWSKCFTTFSSSFFTFSISLSAFLTSACTLSCNFFFSLRLSSFSLCYNFYKHLIT
jgi:hypothetical protein